MSEIISRSGLWTILPSLRCDSPLTSESGRPSATSLQVKSNSLRPTQSIAGDAFKVSVGSTAACAPTNPIVVDGFCSLIAAATFASLRSEGVEVWMMTWS